MATTSVAFNSLHPAATLHHDMHLARACTHGDAAAFEELVKRYDPKLFRIARHITHNQEDAQDAVQEAFLKAFRKITQFREKSQFSTWLIRITVNESLSKVRKQRHNQEVSINGNFRQDLSSAFDLADWAANPEELYQAFELRSILRRQLQKLQFGLRVVFVLRDIEGLSIEETAEVLELTPVAIKARLWRARLKLRERLSKYFGISST